MSQSRPDQQRGFQFLRLATPGESRTVQPCFLHDDDRDHFLGSRENLAPEFRKARHKRADVSCGNTVLRHLLPPPGDTDVISRIDRRSSKEITIAPRSVRIAIGFSCRSSIECMAVSRVRGRNLTLPERRSLSTPHGIWSHDIVVVDGVTTIVKMAHVRLCHSRMMFVRAYPRETQEMVFDAHERAFAFFRGPVGAASTTIYGRLPRKAIRWGGGWNARIYPACSGTLCVPGLDGSPLLLAS
jgi:hypothetical protein